MGLNLTNDMTIDLQNTEVFSLQASEELSKIMKEYSSQIIDECNRLAAAEAVDGKPSEITAAVVRKANAVFQLSRSIGQYHKPNIWLRIGAAALPIIAGVLPNLLDMTKETNISIVILVAGAAVALVAALIAKDF